MHFPEVENQAITDLVKLCITMDTPDKKLAITFNICQMMLELETEANVKEDTRKMKGFCENLLLDREFKRSVFRRNALITHEPITYFGDLVAKGDMYDYDEKLEEDLTNIEFAITRYLGEVMKFIQRQDIV